MAMNIATTAHLLEQRQILREMLVDHFRAEIEGTTPDLLIEPAVVERQLDGIELLLDARAPKRGVSWR